MKSQERTSLVGRSHRCAYCQAVLPEEPEELRRVFEQRGDQPEYWLVYRCANEACRRRTFVADASSLLAPRAG
jgi:hypothetical protein